MKKFLALFQKAGGTELLRRYCRAHVLFYAMLQVLLQGFSKKSLEIVRLSVDNKILKRLSRKYRSFIAAWKENYDPSLPRAHSNKVWVFWMQGMEQAPALVQRCYRSLQENLPEREIVLLDGDNYKDYVQFPKHIQDILDSGSIPLAHMSDLLRLELLIRYGGTWIDSTVFCSGAGYPQYMLDSDLFLFQSLKPGLDGQATCISNWFITACTNHPLLLLTRDLLYTYYEKHNKLIDYFLFHDFFQLAIEAFPEEWAQVVPFSNSTPHILLLRLFEQYDAAIYRGVCRQTSFHKLSYKFAPEQTAIADTYYEHIMQLQSTAN